MYWSANDVLVASTRKHRRRRDIPPAEDEGARKRTKTVEGLRRMKILVPALSLTALPGLPSLPPAPAASSWAIVPYVQRPVPVPPGVERREDEGEEEAMQVD